MLYAEEWPPAPRNGGSFQIAGLRQTLLARPNGAVETATSLFVDGGGYGVLPLKVSSNGTYPFPYVNVISSAGVSTTDEFAIGADHAPIGNGNGLKLTLDGRLLFLVRINGEADISKED